MEKCVKEMRKRMCVQLRGKRAKVEMCNEVTCVVRVMGPADCHKSLANLHAPGLGPPLYAADRGRAPANVVCGRNYAIGEGQTTRTRRRPPPIPAAQKPESGIPLDPAERRHTAPSAGRGKMTPMRQGQGLPPSHDKTVTGQELGASQPWVWDRTDHNTNCTQGIVGFF